MHQAVRAFFEPIVAVLPMSGQRNQFATLVELSQSLQLIRRSARCQKRKIYHAKVDAMA
jgi:hypothetical protein